MKEFNPSTLDHFVWIEIKEAFLASGLSKSEPARRTAYSNSTITDFFTHKKGTGDFVKISILCSALGLNLAEVIATAMVEQAAPQNDFDCAQQSSGKWQS